MQALSHQQPRIADLPPIKEKVSSLHPQQKDRIIAFANRTVEALFPDVEKRADIMGETARKLDTWAFASVLTIEGAVLANSFFALNLEKSKTLFSIFTLYTILAIPINAAFLAFGLIKAVYEIVNLKRIGRLLHRVQKPNELAIDKLKWIRDRYFKLNKKETLQVSRLVDKHLSTVTDEGKSIYFNKVRDKILENKFQALKRRITPGLAEGVKKEISGLIRDLSSKNHKVILEALGKTEIILNSISRQAKNMLIIHSIGLVAIVLTITTIIGVFIGVASPAFFISLFAISVGLMALQYCLKKGTVAKELEYFYDKLAQFNLHKAVFGAGLPSSQAALSQ